MNVTQPFFATYTKGTTFAPNAGVADISAAILQGCKQVCLANLAATVCYVRIYPPNQQGTPAATAADFPIEPNAQVIISKDNDAVGGSVFCAGVGSIHVISGNGF